MKDLSSANAFQIGDEVRVVSSVIKAGVDLNNRVGTVEETWEKCDVDPTCCCAEFVDENFAVTVRFDGSIDDVSGKEVSGTKDIFTHFFSEDELIKTWIKKDDVNSWLGNKVLNLITEEYFLS